MKQSKNVPGIQPAFRGPGACHDPGVLSAAIAGLSDSGAVVCPFLDQQEMEDLVSVVDSLHYRPARPVMGSEQARVYQDFELCYDIPPEHGLWEFARGVEQLLRRGLSDCTVDKATERFVINDLIVQRYPAGCQGITPHRDHLRYGLLVAIVLLSGDGVFGLCQDRHGRDDREIRFLPGELLLMGGPGLSDGFKRPFHFVNDVSQLRRTIGLRFDRYRQQGNN
jgi:hypothetical protein